jgi:ribosomal protein L24E
MASTPDGHGYWLVASDGGIFSFGNAQFYGSTGALPLQKPVVGMAPTPDGHGYWLVASDGGIFTFGDGRFFGSGGASGMSASALVPTADGQGYWLAGRDGTVVQFGDAASIAGAPGMASPVVAAAAEPGSRGIRLFTSDGTTAYLTSGKPAAVSAPLVTAASASPISSYTFMTANPDGTPVRWNPCAPIRYVTNLAQAPAGAANLLQAALAAVTAATGISFVNDGATTEVPTANRQVTQSRYGSGWAPVLIAWSVPGQSSLLPGGSVIGEGQSTWVSTPDGRKVFVTGQAVIDSSSTTDLSVTLGGGSTLGELLLHELGHVMGLGHTTDASEIMFPVLVPHGSSAYGSGDRQGLSRLGMKAGCLVPPSAG